MASFLSGYYPTEADWYEVEPKKQWSPYFILALICGFILIVINLLSWSY